MRALRRNLLALGLAATVVAVPPATASAGTLVRATIKPGERGRAIPRTFLGFSAEWNSVGRLTGTLGTGLNPVYTGMLKTLARYGNGIPTLRIGGNYQDSAWWNPGNLEPDYENGIFINIRPNVLAGVARSLQASGQRATLGVNLAANDPQLAQNEVRAFREYVPRRYIRGLAIGNEPDFYVNRIAFQETDASGRVVRRIYSRKRGYSGRRYLREWDRVSRAVRRAAGGIKLVGTGGYGVIVPPRRFIAHTRRDLAFYAEHAYPLAGCSPRGHVYRPGEKNYPTLAKLLGQPGIGTTQGQIKQGVAAAHRYRKRYVLDEMNSVSCATRQELSASYATALWGIDQLFVLVALGVDGMNFHVGGETKSPFRFAFANGRWSGVAQPLYYSMLTFARAAGRRGRLLLYPTYTQRPGRGGSANAHVWAVRDGKRLRIVAVNKDLRRGGRVVLRVGGSRKGSLERLTAPSLTSNTGIALGGQFIARPSNDGALEGTRVAGAVRPKRGVYSFTLPRASAALLTIG